MKVLLVILLACGLGACTMSRATPPVEKSTLAANDNVELGLAYLQRADMPQAKEKLRLALMQAPHWPVALDAMAYFLEKTGDNRQAAYYYAQAVKLAPDEGIALNNEGVFLCQQKKTAQAIRLFLKAVKDPDYINSSEAYENAGLCALTIPDNIAAARFFRKALQQDPNRQISQQELALLNGRS